MTEENKERVAFGALAVSLPHNPIISGRYLSQWEELVKEPWAFDFITLDDLQLLVAAIRERITE